MDTGTSNVILNGLITITCSGVVVGMIKSLYTRIGFLERRLGKTLEEMPKEYVLKSDCVEKMKVERILSDKAHDRNKDLIIKAEKTGLDLYSSLSRKVTNNSEKLAFEEGKKNSHG